MELELKEMKLIRTLGKGRIGTVKLYRNSSSQTAESEVAAVATTTTYTAVKLVPRMKAGSSPALAQRIFAEKNALLELSACPGVVKLRGTGKDDQYLYFFMAPLLGGPLYKHFRSEATKR